MRGIIGSFYQRLEALTADSWASQIAMMVPTDQASETYKWLGQAPALREWVGGRLAKGFRENGITIENKLFEGTLEISVDELRRDKTGQVMIRVNDMASRVSEHWHKLLTSIIQTPGLAYDGQDYFDTDHAEGASGAQNNALVAGTVPSLNVGTATAPTVAEMTNAIIDCVAKLLAFKDDQGEPMNANAREFLVMVPTNLWAATAGALNLPVIQNVGGTGTANNLLVSLAGFTFRAVVNPRLDAAGTIFYIFRTDTPTKAFIMQEELFETAWDETKKFANNAIYYGVKALRNVGTGLWQGALKATLS